MCCVLSLSSSSSLLLLLVLVVVLLLVVVVVGGVGGVGGGDLVGLQLEPKFFVGSVVVAVSVLLYNDELIKRDNSLKMPSSPVAGAAVSVGAAGPDKV